MTPTAEKQRKREDNLSINKEVSDKITDDHISNQQKHLDPLNFQRQTEVHSRQSMTRSIMTPFRQNESSSTYRIGSQTSNADLLGVANEIEPGNMMVPQFSDR